MENKQLMDKYDDLVYQEDEEAKSKPDKKKDYEMFNKLKNEFDIEKIISNFVLK